VVPSGSHDIAVDFQSEQAHVFPAAGSGKLRLSATEACRRPVWLREVSVPKAHQVKDLRFIGDQQWLTALMVALRKILPGLLL